MSWLTRISHAVAVPSISTVRLAAGPVTISSRCESPTRKKWKDPLCTPEDIRRTTFQPWSRLGRCCGASRMLWADHAALAAWCSPVNHTSQGVAAEL